MSFTLLLALLSGRKSCTDGILTFFDFLNGCIKGKKKHNDNRQNCRYDSFGNCQFSYLRAELVIQSYYLDASFFKRYFGKKYSKIVLRECLAFCLNRSMLINCEKWQINQIRVPPEIVFLSNATNAFLSFAVAFKFVIIILLLSQHPSSVWATRTDIPNIRDSLISSF